MVICFNCWAWDLGAAFFSHHLLTFFSVLCDCLHPRAADNMPFTSQFFAVSHFLSYIPVSSLTCLCLLHSLQIPSIPHQTHFPITAVFFIPPLSDTHVVLLFYNHQSSCFLVRKENICSTFSPGHCNKSSSKEHCVFSSSVSEQFFSSAETWIRGIMPVFLFSYALFNS